jgi:hypothetical protein
LTFAYFPEQTSGKLRIPNGARKETPMRTRKTYARKKVTQEKRVADAHKALKQTQKVLKAELRKVNDYVKALEGWISFRF